MLKREDKFYKTSYGFEYLIPEGREIYLNDACRKCEEATEDRFIKCALEISSETDRKNFCIMCNGGEF